MRVQPFPVRKAAQYSVLTKGSSQQLTAQLAARGARRMIASVLMAAALGGATGLVAAHQWIVAPYFIVALAGIVAALVAPVCLWLLENTVGHVDLVARSVIGVVSRHATPADGLIDEGRLSEAAAVISELTQDDPWQRFERARLLSRLEIAGGNGLLDKSDALEDSLKALGPDQLTVARAQLLVLDALRQVSLHLSWLRVFALPSPIRAEPTLAREMKVWWLRVVAISTVSAAIVGMIIVVSGILLGVAPAKPPLRLSLLGPESAPRFGRYLAPDTNSSTGSTSDLINAAIDTSSTSPTGLNRDQLFALMDKEAPVAVWFPSTPLTIASGVEVTAIVVPFGSFFTSNDSSVYFVLTNDDVIETRVPINVEAKIADAMFPRSRQ